MKLSDLKPNTKAIVIDIQGDPNLKKRILGMGITIGTEIKVIRNAPLKDPIEIEVRGYNLSIRRSEAEFIIVKQV